MNRTSLWVKDIVAEEDGLQTLPVFADWLEDQEDSRHIGLRNWLTAVVRVREHKGGEAGKRSSIEMARTYAVGFGDSVVSAFLLAALTSMPAFTDDADQPVGRIFELVESCEHMRRLFRLSVLSALSFPVVIDTAGAASTAAFNTSRLGRRVNYYASESRLRLCEMMELAQCSIAASAVYSLLIAVALHAHHDVLNCRPARNASRWLSARLDACMGLISTWNNCVVT